MKQSIYAAGFKSSRQDVMENSLLLSWLCNLHLCCSQSFRAYANFELYALSFPQQVKRYILNLSSVKKDVLNPLHPDEAKTRYFANRLITPLCTASPDWLSLSFSRLSAQSSLLFLPDRAAAVAVFNSLKGFLVLLSLLCFFLLSPHR